MPCLHIAAILRHEYTAFAIRDTACYYGGSPFPPKSALTNIIICHVISSFAVDVTLRRLRDMSYAIRCRYDKLIYDDDIIFYMLALY